MCFKLYVSPYFVRSCNNATTYTIYTVILKLHSMPYETVTKNKYSNSYYDGQEI